MPVYGSESAAKLMADRTTQVEQFQVSETARREAVAAEQVQTTDNVGSIGIETVSYPDGHTLTRPVYAEGHPLALTEDERQAEQKAGITVLTDDQMAAARRAAQHRR